MEVTKEALFIGLEQVKPGNRISDISSAIETHGNLLDLMSQETTRVMESGKIYMKIGYSNFGTRVGDQGLKKAWSSQNQWLWKVVITQ